MHRLPLALALLVGCPHAGASASEGPARVRLEPNTPMLCVSAVPEAGRLPKRDRGALAAALEHLGAHRVEAARAALESASNHPAVGAARAATAMLASEFKAAQTRLDDLVRGSPDDACLLAAAAYADLGVATVISAKGDNATTQVDRARDRARSAWQLDPTNGDIGALYAFILVQTGETQAAEAIVAKVLETVPGHPYASFLAALARLDAAPMEALELLAAASAGGIQVAPVELEAAFRADRLDIYLRTASRVGLPMGDDGALATADNPVAAFHQLLGYAEGQQLVATLHTSAGDLTCTLLPERAPVTVANFVALARGTQEWTDPRTGETSNRPLYDGTILHRVIPGFMIQGGDPLGEGTGGPGYQFLDEIRPDLGFAKPGVLAMANSGPATNGSQFFITEAATAWLNGRHTVFGACDAATVARVKQITAMPRDARDRPTTPIIVTSVEVSPR